MGADFYSADFRRLKCSLLKKFLHDTAGAMISITALR
jgi:hypothetical protein